MPTRRAVLTAALAGALGACTPDSTPAPRPSDTGADPDEALALEALAAQTAFLALLDAVTRDSARRLRALASTRTVHERHVALLTEAVPNPPTTQPSPGPALTGAGRSTYLALARAEDQLGQTLRRAAARAESGPFARVLASMAAAAAQQSFELRRLP